MGRLGGRQGLPHLGGVLVLETLLGPLYMIGQIDDLVDHSLSERKVAEFFNFFLKKKKKQGMPDDKGAHSHTRSFTMDSMK